MKAISLLPVLLSFSIPVQASVHVTQNENGSYSVSKYEDGNPQVVIQRRDMRETLTKTTYKEVPAGYDKKTASGLKKQNDYLVEVKKWMIMLSGRGPRTTKGDVHCSKQGRYSPHTYYCPKGDSLVAMGGPKTPEYIHGVDLVPATKRVKVETETKNPNYLQFKYKRTCYSGRAANPGAVWIIGSQSTMTQAEWSTYAGYLGYKC